MTARRVFEVAAADVESGAALEGLAEALYLQQEYSAAAAHYERAYTAYRRERNSMAAGRAARTVGWICGSVLGNWAVRSGWFARARGMCDYGRRALERTRTGRPEPAARRCGVDVVLPLEGCSPETQRSQRGGRVRREPEHGVTAPLRPSQARLPNVG
ncbi:MAG: hypothetical protein ACRDZO_24665 [Egibacteraceae bacterium]